MTETWARLIPERIDQARDLVVNMVLAASTSLDWTRLYTLLADKTSLKVGWAGSG
jgi:hypothetical protein